MNKHFEIFRVHNERLKHLTETAARPHEHNYEEIIVVIKGTIIHFIDFESTELRAPFVSYISKGKTHRIKPISSSKDSDGFVIRFQSEFASESIFKLYHLFHDNANAIFSTKKTFNRFVSLCKIMQEESNENLPDFSIIKNLLDALINMLINEKVKSSSSNLSTIQDAPFIKFLQLLEENFHHSHSVSFYAEQLHMSSRNLNHICQKAINKSITDIIQTRKLIQAKNLLTTTDKTINEIGFEIGYNEKSYFSNIFKKKTGKTPSAFRKEIKMLFS